MMSLRMVAFALVLLTAPITVEAQQERRVPLIGTFGSPESPTDRHLWEAFRQGLRDLGYIEGRNVAIQWRQRKSGQTLAAVVSEVIGLGVDVIVAPNSAIAVAAKQTTSTIPIVMISGDPIADGMVGSLARPGGNVTGVSALGTDVVGKQVQLLKEALPRISRVAVLWNPDNPFHPAQTKEAQVAILTMGMQPQMVPARGLKDLDGAFSSMSKAGAEALLVLVDGPVFHPHRATIADLAARHRLPTMYPRREHIEAGGLLAYGTDRRDLFRRLAVYVDRILKGAKPGDLPVEQPTKFEFIINLKAARALGLTIAPSLLHRADQVIE